MKFLLYYHSLDECCILFDPRTGSWTSITLGLSTENRARLQQSEMVCSSGGTLWFANGERDELIYCNPLQDWWCSPTERGQHLPSQISTAKDRTIKSRSPAGWRLSHDASHNYGRFDDPGGQGTVVENHDIDNSPNGSFQLSVYQQYRIGTPTVSLEVQDSRNGARIRVPNIRQGFHLLVFPTTSFFHKRNTGCIMVGLYRTDVQGSASVLAYDIANGGCHWVRGFASCLLAAPELLWTTTIFATVNGAGNVELVVLSELERTLVKTTFPAPLNDIAGRHQITSHGPLGTPIVKFSEILSFLSLEHEGDISFFVSLFRQPGEVPVRVSVRTRDLVSGSETISTWTEWPNSAWSPVHLPAEENFHILEVS